MKNHRARVLIATCALIVASIGVIPGCFLRSKPNVNLLLIVVDSLRSDALSQSIGAARTPNMMGLVNDGIALRGCYAHSSATLPAHAAIASARLPHTSGVRNDVQPIDASVPLLAEHLRDEGWQTFGAVSTHELVPPGANQGLDRGFQQFRSLDPLPTGAAQVSAQAIAFIESANAEHPWFVYANYSDPAYSSDVANKKDVAARVLLDGAAIGTVRTHDEDSWSVEIDIAPGKHRFEMRSESTFNLRRFEAGAAQARFLPTFEVGGLFAPLSRVVISIQNDQDKVVTCRFEARIRAVQSLAESRARYTQQVEAVDRAVGQVVAALKAAGHYENTLIVVTGSHGESLGEHGITGHDITLYDEVLRVPLVLKLKEGEERRAQLARRQFDLVRHIDLAPTMLDLLGERPMRGAEGQSLLDGGLRELIAESHPPEALGSIVARRDDRYKLVYVALENRFEMYDVLGDTLEMDNLFELQGQFRAAWQAELKAVARSAPQAAQMRVGTGPTVDPQAETKAPAAARN